MIAQLIDMFELREKWRYLCKTQNHTELIRLNNLLKSYIQHKLAHLQYDDDEEEKEEEENPSTENEEEEEDEKDEDTEEDDEEEEEEEEDEDIQPFTALELTRALTMLNLANSQIDLLLFNLEDHEEEELSEEEEEEQLKTNKEDKPQHVEKSYFNVTIMLTWLLLWMKILSWF